MRLTGLLFDGGLSRGGMVACAGDTEWDRSQLESSASSLAAELEGSVGPVSGRPVGVMLPNSVELIAALFGVWRAGAVYVPLNPRLTDRELGEVLAGVRPAAVVTSPSSAARVRHLPAIVTAGRGWTPRPGDTPGLRDDTGDGSRQDEGGGSRRHDPGTRVPLHDPARVPLHDPDIAAICFTSGTTGAPRPVLMRHSGVLELMDGVISRLRGRPRPRQEPQRPPMPNLIPVSLSLWAGIYNVLFAFRVGAPVVVMESFSPAQFVSLVRRFQIRSTVLPPAAMTALLDDPSISDLSPLRFVRSISAPLSPLQARRFRDRFGIAVLNGYGQTEIGGEVVGWNAEDSRLFGDSKLGSVGRPHRGVEVRVVDGKGSPLAAGEQGELQLKVPSVAAGYADGGDLSERLDREGWFRTGDLGRIDRDGFVWVEGRLSDMINRGGLKVFPGEVEEVLRLSPAVEDAAVVGVPDARLGEVPVAFVVAASDRAGTTGPAGPTRALDATDALDPTELEELCRAHLVAYKVPVRFECTRELPRNEAGKVLKGDLVERAARSARDKDAGKVRAEPPSSRIPER